MYELSGTSKGTQELEGWSPAQWLGYCVVYLFEILVYLKIKENNPVIFNLSDNFFSFIEGKNPEEYILNEIHMAAVALFNYDIILRFLDKEVNAHLTSQERLDVTSQELVTEIRHLEIGESICLPFAWSSIAPTGLLSLLTTHEESAHAVYTYFTKKDMSSYEILIDNLGLGSTEGDSQGRSYYPVSQSDPATI